MSIIVTIMLLFGGMKSTEAQSGLIQKGKASFYSKRFHGKKTSSGERYQNEKLTAAHISLPMNTMVEVTNLSNNQSVVVRINDRGPHGKGRIIDLAYAAAKTLGIVKTGIANVAIRVVGNNRKIMNPATADLFPLNPSLEPLLAPVDNI
ncbi:septal ring lytic transglycosylase RlpA family protein [Larkinella terrae]|uniref:Probable endolytic peptidoglycan transglycosylase RlpA n=1 Tax=Larkinella terrae TaxID=2025311 RepID=A0A7K0EDP1_9BACT|nr:septal ring lytic transglycosylase RlpA family protein [Larkinella terrae]MRS59842.1 septal ring lytic transglycosylase RlpA family protein [Larkinella terrae]